MQVFDIITDNYIRDKANDLISKQTLLMAITCKLTVYIFIETLLFVLVFAPSHVKSKWKFYFTFWVVWGWIVGVNYFYWSMTYIFGIRNFLLWCFFLYVYTLPLMSRKLFQILVQVSEQVFWYRFLDQISEQIFWNSFLVVMNSGLFCFLFSA